MRNPLHLLVARWLKYKYSYGCTPPPHEWTLSGREYVGKTNDTRSFLSGNIISLPLSTDWRSYCTPVKKQGKCGSCVAFSALATMETNIRIARKQQNLNIDLSEAHLFYCPDASAYPGNCKDGWWPDLALKVLQARGVTEETYLPYIALQPPPYKLKAGWDRHIAKIVNWTRLTDAQTMKSWMIDHGPLMAVFTIYTDFNSYKNGIYVHRSGVPVTGHCVSVVGYNDAARYWICKNSFGDKWGEKGYFRIGYGECGIDSMMWGMTV